MLIKFEDVYKSFGAHDVLNGVSFQVQPGEHVGLVGRNGAGKTTLFRLALAEGEADRGEVKRARGLRIGWVEQQPSFEEGRTVREEALSVFAEMRRLEAEMSRLEHVMSETPAETADEALDAVMESYSEVRHQYEAGGGFTYSARTESVLGGLGFDKADLDTAASKLSGGQKARLALARILLSEPDLVLLDEPTNHLDVEAVEWLEEFLSSYKPAYVIISHDRFLLDHTVTKIVELDEGKACVYSGNYSAYVRQREERILAMTRQYEKQQELISRTEEFIRRNLAGQKTKQAKSRRNMLERMEKVGAVREQRAGNFDLQGSRGDGVRARGGASLLVVEDMEIGYRERSLCSGIELRLFSGDRLGIVGPNGSGKSTLLKTLAGRIQPLAGGYNWGASTAIAYYDQELADLDPVLTVIEELRRTVVLNSSGRGANGTPSDGEMRNFLARFLFIGDDAFKPVGALSGGERSRLSLAKLVRSRANVLLLDEPTNHLDIASREAMEQALDDYHGTIVTVSHDRYFLDRIATSLLVFEKSGVKFHYGGYSDYYEQRHPVGTAQPAISTEPSEPRPAAASKTSGARQTSTKAKKKGSKGRSPDQIESEIAELEQQLATLAESLSSPATNAGRDQLAELGRRHQSVMEDLKTRYEEWETVSKLAGASEQA
ncbi:MAG TPA: ABC-F family ATP-binding cassette domain-containing protein [Blastocatellia bacterium]|nr:ABC-F family ATP-binding cassette domain-containing protein [Blastocatellia bacterium]